LGLDLEEIRVIQKSKSLISENEWIGILVNVFKYIVRYKTSDTITIDIIMTISPFFFLRVLKYFEELNEIKNKDDIDVSIFK